MKQAQANTSVKLPVALHARLARLAEIRQRSSHSLMVKAIDVFITREEQREALRLAGMEAWKNYEETGLPITGEEFSRWVEDINQGEKAPLPKCHV